ncbi:eukaryotic translation initiation factor subunit [Niveomyces insectorum RCEF 264]|uniref:Eukaryotic translation initiation factor 2A n=1 Tax=Niveomyces insectorum RCEF 264 TaxID=1081102 RepID=A0A167SR11_9HYPO|nr:eukaryotic translation initiation factor subunit [Niveomyces insectorum RCEF 264]
MASPLQFAYRTQKAIGVFDADPVYESLPGFVPPPTDATLRCCVYSSCGRYFAWASATAVAVCDASVGHVLTSLPLDNVFELGFSPGGTFLSTWERPAKDANGDATKNLKVWRVVDGSSSADGPPPEPLGAFVQKAQTGWNLQYTADEQFCARLVTNEVQFYLSGDLRTVHHKLRVEGVATFALAPGKTHSVAVFVPERKGQPAAVRVFNVPHFDAPVSQKTFFKGDKVQLKWNAQGSSLLVLAQTDVDKSNKSYYGETTLYLLSAGGGFDARVTLDKEGPIHDVAWSPNAKEFAVTYGYMPAKTTVFNQRAEPKHSFALGPRNTISFSPGTGRFVLVAGFGNLAGQIDVYDLAKDYRKVCTIESGNPSVCEWSPDARFILTATTSPRLRVDNGVKLWHVGGGLVYHADMIELYNVLWRPQLRSEAGSQAGVDPLATVPVPHASALAYLGTRKTPSKPAGAYRPPGARGASTPLHFKREDEGGSAHVMGNGSAVAPGGGGGVNGFGRARRQVPGAELVELSAAAPVFVPGAEPVEGHDTLSKAALKNKKKRGNRKANREADGPTNGADGGGLAPPFAAEGGHNGGAVHQGRSPERRGYHQLQPHHHQQSPHHHQHSRSQSRNNAPGGNGNNNNNNNNGSGRARSNTQRNRDGHPYPVVQQQQQQQQQQQASYDAPEVGATSFDAPAPAPPSSSDPLSPGGSNTPTAKKMRSLQKKIRAIEDLEMRHAGGEKLEDTQIKKIGTKATVLRELEALERQG